MPISPYNDWLSNSRILDPTGIQEQSNNVGYRWNYSYSYLNGDPLDPSQRVRTLEKQKNAQAFAQRHPEVMHDRYLLSMMSEYMEKNNIRYTVENMEQTLTVIREQRAKELEESTRRIETARLQGIMEEKRTEMLFSDGLEIEREA